MKQSGLVNRHGVILLHDYARPHVSKSVLTKLKELDFETLPYLAYSPDLSPPDFHFFRHLSHFLQEKLFSNESEVESTFEEFLTPCSTEFHRTGINNLVLRWQKCFDAEGDYFD
ncbi:Histone-lysine N-methyltransferase SETMAR [Dufourea novaeangliae]|uniref:Histone-lysine N-methyltransferase SETMAR n=1 Tax=Dufourea novaeangliae TaxID=178035 RepID=A0A154PKS4_DUFNO|nr:Histone-lysine N-methyltransferase SETMAR [Dufourea novaeangliae]